MEITIFRSLEREQVVELIGSAEEMNIQSEDFSLDDDVRVTCRLHRNGDLIRVEGNASASLNAQCARCLDPFRMDVVGFFTFVVKRLPLGIPIPADAEEGDEDSEEFIFVEHDVTSIDITDIVRDSIILALPMKVLCRENCLGLCPVCGSNRNDGDCGCETSETDPRWKSLIGLINRDNKK